MMYKYQRIKQIPVDLAEMKRILELIKSWGHWEFTAPPKDKRIINQIYIENKPLNLVVTGRGIDGKDLKLKSYVFAKDGREPELEVQPYVHYLEMKRHSKVHDSIKEDKKLDSYSSSPFTYTNVDFNYEHLDNIVCYDTNLTYFYLLSQKFPNTQRPLGAGIVKDGEVGFEITDQLIKGQDGKIRSKLQLTRTGRLADFRYSLMESPFKDYIEFKLQQLKELEPLRLTDYDLYKKRRAKVKSSINIAVGCLQHHNPIWRAWIVESGNARIKALMDTNTIYSNTDCIVSLLPRPDITISGKIGDFKIEHQGSCYIEGFTITWDDGKENRRGFKAHNKYRFDEKELKLYEI